MKSHRLNRMTTLALLAVGGVILPAAAFAADAPPVAATAAAPAAPVVAAPAPVTVKARPVAVAVVDVQKTFEALQEKVQLEADLQTKADRLKQEEQDRQKKLEELQKDMELLATGSPALAQKQEELEKGAIELQAWRNFQSQKLTRERGVQIESLYRKMLDAIGRTAKENNFDIVLFKEAPADFHNAKPEQLPTLIQVRKVLWAADDLDLTDQVIQKMNNEFKNMAAPKK